MGVFLRAEWRSLAMFNYAVDPAVVAPLVPFGTELDYHQGETFVSIVAFRFLDTRVMGIPVPLHRDFDEVNLRFYIRRREGGWVKRAVSFVQELVPRRAIAYLARALYNEPYRTARIRHRIIESASQTDAAYMWSVRGRDHAVSLIAQGQPQPLEAGSLNEFIAEHYWGYAAQRNGDTVEYAVDHPAWRIRPATAYRVDVGFEELYGRAFRETFSQPPRSVFLSEGSPVTVSHGARIRAWRSGLSGLPPSRRHSDHGLEQPQSR